MMSGFCHTPPGSEPGTSHPDAPAAAPPHPAPAPFTARAAKQPNHRPSSQKGGGSISQRPEKAHNLRRAKDSEEKRGAGTQDSPILKTDRSIKTGICKLLWPGSGFKSCITTLVYAANSKKKKGDRGYRTS